MSIDSEIYLLENEAADLINDFSIPRDDLLKLLGQLFEKHHRLRWKRHWEKFYRRYIEYMRERNQSPLPIQMVDEILQEPALQATGRLFGFMIFAMLYALTDAEIYFDELGVYRPDIAPAGLKLMQ